MTAFSTLGRTCGFYPEMPSLPVPFFALLRAGVFEAGFLVDRGVVSGKEATLSIMGLRNSLGPAV